MGHRLREPDTHSPFETRADAYDQWYDIHQDLFLKPQELIRSHVKSGKGQILEIGCGSGRFTSSFGVPVGIDSSRALCQIAHARGVTIIQGDDEFFPVRTGSMDQVVLFISCGMGRL